MIPVLVAVERSIKSAVESNTNFNNQGHQGD